MDNENIMSWLEKGIDVWVPGQTVDCVIIGYGDHTLHVLTLRWKNSNFWALPGGFVHRDENLDDAARRVLKDRTGLDFPFLKQFHTFGDKGRLDTEIMKNELKSVGVTNSKVFEFLTQRLITTGYLALVKLDECELQQDVLSDAIEWKPVKELPQMIFDHNEIVERALMTIKMEINYLPVGLSLLPEKFTMKDFQKLYECIAEVALDRANFQKKILKLQITKRLEKQMNGGAHKAPYLYSFDKEKYNELLEKGIGFMS